MTPWRTPALVAQAVSLGLGTVLGAVAWWLQVSSRLGVGGATLSTLVWTFLPSVLYGALMWWVFADILAGRRSTTRDWRLWLLGLMSAAFIYPNLGHIGRLLEQAANSTGARNISLEGTVMWLNALTLPLGLLVGVMVAVTVSLRALKPHVPATQWWLVGALVISLLVQFMGGFGLLIGLVQESMQSWLLLRLLGTVLSVVALVLLIVAVVTLKPSQAAIHSSAYQSGANERDW